MPTLPIIEEQRSRLRTLRAIRRELRTIPRIYGAREHSNVLRRLDNELLSSIAYGAVRIADAHGIPRSRQAYMNAMLIRWRECRDEVKP
jgi:hypothetical protein